MVKCKQGFISLPLLILMSYCLSLSSFLCYKTMTEYEILMSMKQVNEQIQHERKILQEIYCLIQCDVSDVIYLDIDGQHVVVNFEGENCYVSDSLVSMIIEVDYQDKVLRNVTIEK